ncbi:MAG: flagellar basal body P-ring formation protein FlgA [Phycisphaeraceae bacterium]|nr:flagellar basal body P-ring formation protein FlgA [Phycisphaeraceae bacterium]
MITALCLAAVLLVASARGQGLIEMKSVARVAPGSPVTLADVATLSGDEAIALAHVEVLPATPAPSRLTIAQLRRRLGEERGVNWGRITLRGSTCTVQALDPAPKSAAPTARVGTPAVPDPNSVRQAVSDRIARILQADAQDLRLTFDAADDEFLNQTTTGRTLEIKPTASSDRLPLALTLYEGDRIVASKSIRVGVLVRRNVVIAAASKSRGETIAESDVTIDEQWVGPNVKAATPEEVIGAAAQGRIAAGQVILSGSIAAPMVVNKGEIVSVSCVSGTVVLTTKARALASARVGDVIQFQGLDDKRTFTARMSGRGRAVVVVETSEDRT